MRSKIYNKKRLLLPVVLLMLFSLGFALISCDKALFDELAENRIEIRLKGTYASNSPKTLDTATIDTVNSGDMVDDSVDDAPNTDTAPTKIMLDIAELSIVDTDGNEEKFANVRQVKTASLLATDDFFDGTGIVLGNNDDVSPDKTYSYVKVYLRKIIFDNATNYTHNGSSWVLDTGSAKVKSDNSDGSSSLYQTVFDEQDVSGYDINTTRYYLSQYYNLHNYYWAKTQNLVYPLTIPIVGGLKFDNSDEKTVLEIRLIVNNFIKKYEYHYLYDDNFDDTYEDYIVHFYGFSDWLRDAKDGWNNRAVENADYNNDDDEGGTDEFLGGNIIAVARSYVPSKSQSISGTVGTDEYVIAIPATDTLTGYDDITHYAAASSNIRTTYVAACDVYQNVDDSTGAGSYNELYEKNVNDTDDMIYPTSVSTYSTMSTTAKVEEWIRYLKNYEELKNRWHTAVSGCADYAAYDTAWYTFETNANKFKVAPIATYTSDGNYTLTNVPPGSYNLYKITTTLAYGALFDSATHSFVQYGTVPVTVTTGTDLSGISW
ncbi:MAG: hypothetical protein GY754_39440 [bacterium]|nr:hypothetical protein [bacterium]